MGVCVLSFRFGKERKTSAGNKFHSPEGLHTKKTDEHGSSVLTETNRFLIV